MESRPVHVLFLDDEPTTLALLKQIFQKEPFLSAYTKDPADAAYILSKEPVKVVVSDQRMPTTTGIDFLKRVKENHPDVVRILLTADTDIRVAREAVNVGQVYRYLSKPPDHDALRVTVRQAIDLYDSVIERRELHKAIQRKNEELLNVNVSVQAFNEKQREFTSTVSHELRTPLAAIKMALDIIMSGTTGPLTGEQNEFLKKAKANVDRLHRLINNVLDLSKMEAGKITLRIKLVNIITLIEEVVDSQILVAKAKGLNLVVNTGEDIPFVALDRDRIMQVLINLLSNAIKFTDRGGITVQITSPEPKDTVEVRISDTGPGISPEDLAKLFEKFVQLDGSVNNKSGGTGLGLAICKSIVECHGGRAWAESEVGKGTTMCFTLPVEEKPKGAV